ncbi:MAG: ExbD/TolR family protein [Polyangiales bacterium]
MTQQEQSEQDNASILHVKRIIRLKVRRRGEDEHQFLNIYPMMDMMTILLVFLIMQFASSTASIVQESEELKIPYSTATKETTDGVPLQISRNEIVVAGKQVVTLRRGQVDASNKQGGGTGFVITPLLKQLQKEAKGQKEFYERVKKKPFEGKALIVADQNTPYRTVSEVLYTLGQTEFKELHFVVNKRGGS